MELVWQQRMLPEGNLLGNNALPEKFSKRDLTTVFKVVYWPDSCKDYAVKEGLQNHIIERNQEIDKG